MGPALLWLLLSPAAHAACDNASLVASAAAAEQAFGEDAPEKVQREAAVIADDLACLKEPLLPDTAAGIYRTLALAEVSRGFGADPSKAAASIRAMLAIHPDASFPADWIADGLPLQQALASAHAPAATPPAPITAPDGVHWLIDGAPAETRPTDRPVFAQCIWDSDHGLKAQGWVPASGELPACPAPPPPPPPAGAKATCEGRWSRGKTLGAISVGVGSALLAGTAYAVGSAENSAFYDTSVTYTSANFGNLRTLQTAANVLGGASIGFGAIGLTFGVGAGVKGCLAH